MSPTFYELRLGQGTNPPAMPRPDDDGIAFSYVDISAQLLPWDGYLQVDLIRRKGQWTVTWSGLSPSEWDTLRTALEAADFLSFDPMEGTLYTVWVTAASRNKIWTSEGWRYFVTATFLER